MTEPTSTERAPEPPPAPPFPHWLGVAVVVLLSLQLGLGYVQGALLHRQQAELHSLRTDLQDLTEALEQSHGAADSGTGSEDWRPASRQAKRGPFVLAARTVLDGDEEDRIRKEQEKSAESARKAINDARKAQGQLSVAENAHKAEAAATQKRVDTAQDQWQKWVFLALGLGVLGLAARAWIRRNA